MTDRNENCEARISAHMTSREDDARKLLAAAQGETFCKVCGEEIGEETTENAAGDYDVKWAHEEGDASEYDHAAEPDDEYNEDSIYEYPLGIEKFTVVRIDLSTGGPGDWLEAKLDSDGDMVRVDYHFNDWFDHAQRSVGQGSDLWRLAEYYVEGTRG